ncbi:isopeptide-forming domain-containing fimbrial protein [Microbulbifer sp. OS29]|uniref:Isopeptide-forming domain-containing fimbrial protein n=1 Tax=Microbulbifer okhotskensis TaxID=2926617 RepID=A0A9X2J5H8_9GAMM|nr:isopeptide-forming domain-containing fimbrial protein [Microbulbifer okhotskensis]MCO1334424.1 isopeptide-forming domain-containing fimbrial protein [Microbulbifer okhotskensis]
MKSEVVEQKSCKHTIIGFLLVFGLAFLSVPQAWAHHNCPSSPDDPRGFNILSHRSSDSWCVLCGDGQVTIQVDVPSIRSWFMGTQHIENITVTENLGTSGLEYVTGSTSVSSGMVLGEPTISGTTLTWDQNDLSALAERDENTTLTITFNVRSQVNEEEELVVNNRTLNASATFDYCSASATDTSSMELNIREPEPSMDKRGRNIDAAQTNYTNNVYGNIEDDVLWRVRITNSGAANMQDARFDDLMSNPNMDINYACPSESAALAVANNNGADPGGAGCVAASNSINNFELSGDFSSGSGRTDVPSGGTLDIYLVGKVNTSCTDGTNTVSDLQWGCEIDSDTGVGGISDPAEASFPGSDTSEMRTETTTDLNISQVITGTNLNQPLGAAGYVTLTINNQTGGSVKDIQFVSDLPDEYVVDTTFTPVITQERRGIDSHGANYNSTYPGKVDILEWRVGSTWNQWDTDPMNNNRPEFRLLSSTVHSVYADQEHMMRQGDEIQIRFRIVTIETDFFDTVADLDIDEEAASTSTDPNSNISLMDNVLTIDYEDFCPSTSPATQVETESITPDPEDLDVSTVHPLYIVRDSGTSELTVDITNNGGHDADNYSVYVTFGEAMTVLSSDRSCTRMGQPNVGTVPEHPLWNQPDYLPDSATVYLCDSTNLGGVISPGNTERVVFLVEKNHAATDDDLTFRADVVGEITLYDGAALYYPDPATLTDTTPNKQLANNYTLDGMRARVMGFNLVKERSDECNELTSESTFPNSSVLIGEECRFEIQAGGWFGFDTPGFTLIEVRDIDVLDDLPDGQGYIADVQLNCADVTLPHPTSQANCVEISNSDIVESGGLNSPLSEIDLQWGITSSITGKDRWFLSDMTTRLLNDPVDIESADPNQHANDSIDYARSQFTAVFDTETIEVDNYNSSGILTNIDGVPTTVPGFPDISEWSESVTVTEPNIEVDKKVCNESLYGAGTSCSNFVDLTDEGHRDQTYIFRLTLTNRAADSGVNRAPAYDLVVTDTLDPTGQMCVQPFDSDNLDNDADGSSETTPGADGLLGISAGADDYSVAAHCSDAGTPAIITFSHEHSTALERMNPGDSVTLYYRVKPHQSVAPLQIFSNTFFARYDSLEGDFGSQTSPQIDSDIDNDGVGDGAPPSGRARHYQSADAHAQMQIIEVKAEPKQALELSNGTASGTNSDTAVVGEEIRYELTAQIPAAKLRNFIIRDELPAGMRCIEGQTVDLSASPYDAAGFVPGGPFAATCTSIGTADYVQWDFGDQELTTVAGSLFDFPVEFIARIDNSSNTNDGDILGNGGSYTTAQVTYVDQSGAAIAVPFDSHEILVQEAQIQLAKSFSVTNSDADDILTVTVTAENTGTTEAYNLQVLDDLTGTKLVYLGNIGGSDPPNNVDITRVGANAPIFSWNRSNTDYAISVGDIKTFTFEVQVEQGVSPHEILDNTIEARWQSLPGTDVALNSSNSIGTDGAADGMRIGVLPNLGDPINDYETTASAQTEVLPLQLSKTDLEPSVVATIGAHKKFQLEIRLPEGISQNVVITDQLGSPEGYVLSHNTDYDIVYEFVGIETINGSAPSEAAFNSFPGDNTAGNASWDLGTVDTNSENDTVAGSLDPLIRITYFARIENDLATNRGDSRQNDAALTYRNGESGSTENLNDSTSAVAVVEPLLTISKTVSNATSPGNLPVGGDVLEYLVTVQHDSASNAAAYELNLVDTLPSELTFDSSFTPLAMINGSAVTGFIATPAAVPTGPLIWGRDNGDNSLDLQLGETLLLTYRTQVTGVFGSPISNSVMLDWTSLDNSSINDLAYERDGAGCPTIAAPDDYCVGPAQASIDTVDNTSIAKIVVGDSDTATAIGTLRVGDTVTYQLSLNLQAGTTPGVTVDDVLPSGLVFDSIVSVNGDTAAPYDDSLNDFTYSAITVPASGDTGTVTWNLGDITSNFGNTNNFVIEYTAKVVVGSGIASPTATLTNTAQLNYSGAASTLQDSATITVLQPVIDSLSKTEATWPSSHMNVNPANDVMQFTLHACNSGLAAAYDLSLTDDLATQMDEASIANLQVTLAGNLLSEGTDYTYTPPVSRGDDMHFTLLVPVDAATCLDIFYEVSFHTDISGGESWVNTFTVNDFWSLPASEGEQFAAVPLGTPYPMGTVATSVTAPQKTLQTASMAAVGEEVVYRIQVPGSATTSAIYDIAMADVLDPSLELVQLQEINSRAFTDNSSGNNIELTLDIIPAGMVAIFEVRARVANNTTAQAGHSFDNQASYSYAATDGGVLQAGGTGTAPTLTVVEPELSAINSVVNQTSPGDAPDAGDLLRFTLNVSATGNAENSSAYDLMISEQLSLGLKFVPGTVIFAAVAQADPTVNGDGITTAQTLQWDRANSDLDITAGANSELVFDVVVLDEVLAAAVLSANASIEWTSLDEDNSSIYERNGTDGRGGLNDYRLENIAAQLTAANDSVISKTRTDDSYGSGDVQLRVGDLVEYELNLSLPEGTAPNTLIVDTLPQGMVFDSTLSINGITAAPFTAVTPFVHSDIAEPVQLGDPASGPTTVSWNIADLINSADNNAANDEFVVRYHARVLNQDVHPWPASNTVLVNSVEFSFDTATGAETRSDSETLDLLQPDLSVAISSTPADGSTLSAGDIIDYSVTVTNSGSAPAYDPVFRDVIPLGLRQAGVNVQSIAVNGVAATAIAPTFDGASGEAIWDFSSGSGYAIEAGQSLEMVYRVAADSSLGAGLSLQNAAYIEAYYSLDDDNLASLGATSVTVDMREDYGPTAPVGVQFNTPNAAPLSIAITQPTASIGEPFNYRITIPETAQLAALHDVTVLMDLTTSAAELEFVSATKVSGSATFTPENTGSLTNLNIGDSSNGIDVPAGEQVIIDVTLRLRDSNPPNVDGLNYSNSASYSYNYDNDNPAAGQGAGTGNTTLDMTVVEPTEITLTKTGPVALQSGLAGTFTLDLHNTGNGPAWDISVTDLLPDNNPGGMCETAPANFAAQISDAAGNIIATLAEGVNFSASFDAASCTLALASVGAAAMLDADHHLRLAYDAYLDIDTIDGDTLTNIAGVTLWHSWDSTLPEARQYTRAAPTDGTPAVLDHEDTYTVTASVPKVTFYKTVENISRGENPATVASPAEVLRYSVTLTNLSGVEVSGIEITDDLDRLNSLPLFQSGSLQLVSAPAGSDSSATDATAGTLGSGLLQVNNLDLAASGNTGDSIQIIYEVTLAAVIDSATPVLNQAQVQLPGQPLQDSDDPNINGTDDPDTVGDEDPTQVLIESEPVLIVQKTSADMTGDPDLLMVADTLRYTLTVENIGNEVAINTLLRDQVPANTTYIANSTRLNGTVLSDVSGASPLASGIAVNTSGEADGFVGASANGAAAVVITFDVSINDVNDGTIISNQGYVNGEGAGSGAFDEVLSDDPATDAPNDPTIDIVGDVPLLIAHKTVQIAVDNISTGIVDPGDVLRYTIAITNMGGVDALEVALTDQVPANTTYVAGTTTLNGVAVADNGGGNSLLDSSLPVSSGDLTPPLPGASEGVITSAQTATVTFDVMVNADTARGTVISNQGSVAAAELPLTLTDADGNPANGAQPTLVIVGDAQLLSIVKEVAVVGGSAAEAGEVLEYLITIENISGVAATYVGITDDLAIAGEGVLTYVADSAMLNGQVNGVTVVDTLITADYFSTYGDLLPGESATLRFQAQMSDNLEIGFTVLNTAEVQWNDPPSTNQASVAIDVGGTPGIANLAGYLWHDVNFNNSVDADERLLLNWAVDLYFNDALMETAQTDETGYFQFQGLVPNSYGGISYEMRYSAPDSGENTASLGSPVSEFTNGPQRISEIFVESGANPQDLNLPLAPNGVIYDSISRSAIEGATLTMLRVSSGQELPDRCFDDEKQQGQVTRSGGYYKFDINFSDPACPANSDYLIQVEIANDDYVGGESLVIPAQTHSETAGFDVGVCLGSNADLLPGTTEHCEVQLSAQQPSLDVEARDAATDYYLRLTLDDNQIPGESQLFNNHVAMDPHLEGALSITKTAAMLNVTRSQLVPYTITFTNTLPIPMTDIQLVDFFPAGFKYVAGSARLDGEAVEPRTEGLQLIWPDLRVQAEQTHELKLLLVVGSGVGEGKYVNRAQMFNQLSGQAASGEASATVRVVPDPTFDCTDVIGKIFDDENMNGYQDAGEGGLPGARVVTATGLNATADVHGRFHITCAVVPDGDRGSNFVLKLDDRSLPSGYRLTTENPRVLRATRGKMLKFNFGASLHRVVRLDMAEAVFEPGTTELRPQWHSRVELLLEKLSEAPSVLRLAYLAENEDPYLVDERLQTIKAQVADDWGRSYGDYELNIETEIFWRRGAPPSKGGLD